MALTKFPARLIQFEIDSTYGSSGGATWTPIGGLNSLTHSPATNRADTTDFDSEGHAEHMVMERGDAWAFAGRKLLDVVTGDGDPGQEAMEALVAKIGIDSYGSFRMRVPGATNGDYFIGSVELTKPGGGHNDPADWSGTVTVSGAVTSAVWT